MEIHSLGVDDDQLVFALSHLFDGPAQEAATALFLGDDRHHLLVASVDDQPIGFITGVEMTHPDKGTEMFVYELAVQDAFRRRGVGQALLRRLADLAGRRGCYGMWVATDDENVAAKATYQAAGGTPQSGQVVFGWTL